MPRLKIYRDEHGKSYAMRYDEERVMIYRHKLDELLKTNAALTKERNEAYADLRAARAEMGSLRTRIKKLSGGITKT